MKEEYRSKESGTTFNISMTDVLNPPEADFWGFNFFVQVVSDATKGKNFRAMLKKSIFPDREGARAFVQGDPLIFLKTAYLDHYSNGESPMLWPAIRDGWIVY